MSFCVCVYVVVKSNNSTMTLFNKTKKACAWWQPQHQHQPQRTIVSDTRLTPDARHIKDTENATTSLRESVLVDSQNTDEANNQPQNSSCYMARVFSFSQEALINLMGGFSKTNCCTTLVVGKKTKTINPQWSALIYVCLTLLRDILCMCQCTLI